ncbi:hypothetical protein B0H14DRAFT_2680089 [Mycena olivaceomarginata]|nr:hypothetical protein B0H14DRAFT_2680089 [Mycena olivaceomarginata]
MRPCPPLCFSVSAFYFCVCFCQNLRGSKKDSRICFRCLPICPRCLGQFSFVGVAVISPCTNDDHTSWPPARICTSQLSRAR